MSNQHVELIAERLRLLGHPVRIRMLQALAVSESAVQPLADDLELTQQNASHHLGLLHEAGIVSRRRVGRIVLYRVADTAVLAYFEEVARWVAAELRAPAPREFLSTPKEVQR